MTRTTLALGALALLSMASAPTIAMAQDVPPTYKADPSVYKIIFEDQNYRVIDAMRKKGVHDKPHSHPVPSIVYFLTDCHDKLTGADGKTRESTQKAGTVVGVPVVKSHSTENIGSGDCHQIFVERK